MNEQASNALVKWREENKGIKTQVLDPLEKSRQNPRSKVLAIRAFCYDCCGGSKPEVTMCPSKLCPLWLHRPWQKIDQSCDWQKNSKEEDNEEVEITQECIS